jgi:putative salt-induced outer membrane protein
VYTQAKSEGERTTNKFYAQSQYDWKIENSPWFPFARVRWERDEFTDYNSRLEVAAGVGRELITEEDFQLRARAGLNGVREHGGSNNGWRLEALLGADADWKIDTRQQLNASLTVFPDLDDTGEYRGLLEAGWSVILNDANSLSLKIGVANEFDSHQEDPFEKNDFRYYIALLFKF